MEIKDGNRNHVTLRLDHVTLRFDHVTLRFDHGTWITWLCSQPALEYLLAKKINIVVIVIEDIG